MTSNTSTDRPSVRQLGDHASDAIKGHFDHFFRDYSGGTPSPDSQGCMMLVTGQPHPLSNLCIAAGSVSGDELNASISPLIDDRFPSAVILLDETNETQAARIESRGFVAVERMQVMSVTPEMLKPTTLPGGYELQEMTPDDDERWSNAMGEGYGLPLDVAAIFGPKRASERGERNVTRHYAVMHGGEIAATSLVYFRDGLAGIYGVATIQAHRKRGLGAHATAEPLRRAWADGYQTGLLQASEMGEPVYSRIGFQSHGHMRLFARIPG